MFSPSPHFFPLPLFFPLSPFIPPLPPCVSSVVGKALLAGWALLSLKCFPPPPIFSPSPFSSPSPLFFPLSSFIPPPSVSSGWKGPVGRLSTIIKLESWSDPLGIYARSPCSIRTIPLEFTHDCAGLYDAGRQGNPQPSLAHPGPPPQPLTSNQAPTHRWGSGLPWPIGMRGVIEYILSSKKYKCDIFASRPLAYGLLDHKDRF